MLANYWPKGFPAPFICENMFIIALWYHISLLSSIFLYLLTLHIVPLKYIFFKLFTLISHASSLLLSFLVLHSCYLILCLHFSSIRLLLNRLLLSCSLSLGLACIVGMQAYIFVRLCVGVHLSACAFPTVYAQRLPRCQQSPSPRRHLNGSLHWHSYQLLDMTAHNQPPLCLPLIINHT